MPKNTHSIANKTHPIYLYEKHRNWAIASLYIESYEAFLDTFLLKNKKNILEESELWIQDLKRMPHDEDREMPKTPYTMAHVKNINLENLKIGCGFELCLKAKLLESGYIVHKSENSEPQEISKSSELKINSDISINFKELTKIDSKYISILGIDDFTREKIDTYRDRRNRIHLPVNPSATALILNKEIDFLKKFVNSEVVQKGNKMISLFEYFKPLEEI